MGARLGQWRLFGWLWRLVRAPAGPGDVADVRRLGTAAEVHAVVDARLEYLQEAVRVLVEREAADGRRTALVDAGRRANARTPVIRRR